MTFALLDVLLPIEELNKISDMFAFYRILGFCAIGVINAILMIVVSYKFFQAIQQCNYKSGEYIKWLRKRDNPFISRLLMLSMLSILGFLLINICLYTDLEVYCINVPLPSFPVLPGTSSPPHQFQF